MAASFVNHLMFVLPIARNLYDFDAVEPIAAIVFVDVPIGGPAWLAISAKLLVHPALFSALSAMVDMKSSRFGLHHTLLAEPESAYGLIISSQMGYAYQPGFPLL